MNITPQVKSDKQWYTIAEKADSIEVTRATVWNWIQKGYLRSTRVGSKHRISEIDWQGCLENFNRKTKR